MKTLLVMLLLSGNVLAIGEALPLKSAEQSLKDTEKAIKSKDVIDYRKFRNICVVLIDDSVAHAKRYAIVEDTRRFSDQAVARVIRDLQDAGYICEESSSRYSGRLLYIYWDKAEYDRSHKRP